MTSKERVLRNYRFQPVDRFTIDFCAESKVYALLRERYGVPDDLALMERLHVDFRYPKPNWIGFPLVDEQGRPTDYFGIPRTGAGDFGYPLVHPLAGVQTVAEVEAYPNTTATPRTAGASRSAPFTAAPGPGFSRQDANWWAWTAFSC